jgi:hypothetical protein
MVLFAVWGSLSWCYCAFTLPVHLLVSRGDCCECLKVCFCRSALNAASASILTATWWPTRGEQQQKHH